MDNIKNPAKKPKLKKSYSNSTIFQKLMVDDVRNKILFTILCLLIYRLGCGITIPFVNTAALQTMFGSTSVLDYYNPVAHFLSVRYLRLAYLHTSTQASSSSF